jgi:hypothetical protein
MHAYNIHKCRHQHLSSSQGNGFLLEGVEDGDAWHVTLDVRTLVAARQAHPALALQPSTPTLS